MPTSSLCVPKYEEHQLALLTPPVTPTTPCLGAEEQLLRSNNPESLPVSLNIFCSLSNEELAQTIAALEKEDIRKDWLLDDPNFAKARAAVRFAARTSVAFNSFKCDRILGFGSNGVVLAGSLFRQEGVGRQAPVAVKIIYKRSEAQMTITKDVPTEIAMLMHLKKHPHPHIIQYHDSWQDELHYYLVTEFHGTDWLHSEGNFTAKEPLIFVNPSKTQPSANYTHTEAGVFAASTFGIEFIPASTGTSDLWAWSTSRMIGILQWALERGFPTDQIYPSLLPPLPRYHIRLAFRQIAQAVAHLHSLGIVHRDIKEENVLIQSTPTPCHSTSPLSNHTSANDIHSNSLTTMNHVEESVTVILCDFGHAVSAKTPGGPIGITSYGTTMLTPPELWTSPRRSSPESKVQIKRCVDGYKADVFALGVLLFTLCHGPGRVPKVLVQLNTNVSPVDRMNVLAMSDTDGVLPLPDMDPRLEMECQELIRWMLAINPRDRPTVEQVLQSTWVSFT